MTRLASILFATVAFVAACWPASAQIPGDSGITINQTPVANGTTGNCLYIVGASPAQTVGQQACGAGTAANIAVGTTTISGGTTTRVLRDNAGVLGEIAVGTSGTVIPLLDGTNTWSGLQTDTGTTTTSPGWYAQLTGDAVPRVRVGLNSADVASIGFGDGTAARDAFLERAAAANIRQGGPDAATAVAQTSSVQNIVAGTTNVAGANRTYDGSRGTGTGVGGTHIFRVATASTTGSTQNTLVTAVTINQDKTASFAGAIYPATQFLSDIGSLTVRWGNAFVYGINAYGGLALGDAGGNVNLAFFIAINPAGGVRLSATNGTTAVPFQISGSALTLTGAAFGMAKMTASGTAPGAAGSKFEVVCGTNAGTAKLVMAAGTSGTAVTVVDNVGAGVTGC